MSKNKKDSVESVSEEVESVSEEKKPDDKKRHWSIRLGVFSTKVMFYGTIIVIVVLTLASVIINNTESILSLKETLENSATPLLGARISMYCLATIVMPRMIFWSAKRNKDESIAKEAKHYERKFTYLIGGMFIFGEIFVVQNIIGTVLG